MMYFRDLQASLDQKEMARKVLQKRVTGSEVKVEELSKEMGELKRRVQFKTNLEKSFGSLQQKYQAKTDELEKLKKVGSLRKGI